MINYESLLRRYKLSLLLNDVVFSDVEFKIVEYLNFRCESYAKNNIDDHISIHKLITFSKISNILRDNNSINPDNQFLLFCVINEWYNYYKL